MEYTRLVVAFDLTRVQIGEVGVFRLGLLVWMTLLAACGPRHPTPKPKPSLAAVASKTPEADRSYRPPNMVWWQGVQAQCPTGRLERSEQPWGAVIWCALPGQRVDASLQNDLGRLARCVHEAAKALREIPAEGKLLTFLQRAVHSEGAREHCQSIRVQHHAALRTYHGLEVLVERRPEPAPSKRVRYRFGCDDCLVSAETIIEVIADIN